MKSGLYIMCGQKSYPLKLFSIFSISVCHWINNNKDVQSFTKPLKMFMTSGVEVDGTCMSAVDNHWWRHL